MFHLLLPALLALSPAVGQAGPARPDDPKAAVPETPYRAPQAYRPLDKPATTPDRHWIEANRTVLGYQPMMLTMPERPAAPGKTGEPAPKHEHEHAAHGGHDGKGHR